MSQWKTGFFGCFEDIPLCLLGTFCSCYLFGQNAEQITGEDKIKSCVIYAIIGQCCPCVIHKPQRQQLRGTYNLEEKPSDLVATSCFCSGCANCQEALELKKRGIAPGTRIPQTSQPR